MEQGIEFSFFSGWRLLLGNRSGRRFVFETMSAIPALSFVTSHCFAAYTTRLACSHKIDADDHQANGSQKENGFKTAKYIWRVRQHISEHKEKYRAADHEPTGFHSRNDHRSLELGWGLVWGKFAQSTPGPQLPPTLTANDL